MSFCRKSVTRAFYVQAVLVCCVLDDGFAAAALDNFLGLLPLDPGLGEVLGGLAKPLANILEHYARAALRSWHERKA
jgi:hypothetical protein